MLDMLGITALINVSSNCPNHFEDSYLYKSIPVEDNHKADISSWFNEAIEFIGEFPQNLFFFFFFTCDLCCDHLRQPLIPESLDEGTNTQATPPCLSLPLI